MCEGPSRITGPIPPDPTLLRDYYKCPLSARGRLEGNALKLDFVSGPLASDPSLYPTCYSARPAQPAPRIRPSGEDILAKGQKGTVGVLLQLEGIFLDKESPPKRKESKNYEKENVRRIREIQKKCKEKELAREHSRPQPVKALWKSQKYENVGSKVKAKIQIQVEGTSIDFVSHNAQNAKRAQMRRSRSLQSLTEVLEQKRREQEEYNSKQKGHVPRYLLQRKDLWRRETEERLRNLPDPDLPPGHTMMPESQRLETLGNLKQTQAQLTKDLVMLPVRADTLGVQRRRSELEKKLSQIEEALKIFSRPKVFIKLDS
ncbi:enkurin domain-containing protein 1 isoform X2 [Alligator mississippiensis]|uniref:Enkurin domain-containing protein 1 isoform X2 n=1 Tax=Alligator sinensis TaxID=38654 RepID=A0A1U7SEP2_ALLSI|nr:enkurin domain-containing protein 1 isoform X2 [Alligator sinensis]XP_059569621.1 enkurin domain-containing protein 1 isoform X2 [Alligator mississippiensis]